MLTVLFQGLQIHVKIISGIDNMNIICLSEIINKTKTVKIFKSLYQSSFVGEYNI